jgi:hypothetical protein
VNKFIAFCRGLAKNIRDFFLAKVLKISPLGYNYSRTAA